MAHPTSSPYTIVRLAAPCSQRQCLAEGDRSALVWAVSRGIASYEVIATRSIRASLLSTLRRQTGSRDARAPELREGLYHAARKPNKRLQTAPQGEGQMERGSSRAIHTLSS